MSTDINISNYEGYLLSYIDGELAADEQAALMAFLERHPAIKQELALWEGTKLQPEDDAPQFGNKALLYRGGDIHLNNYETYLLSYIDNELTAEETTLFEQFVRQHPHVKQEILLWQATRQHPDTSVVFENKSLLYRHTEDRKTVRLRPVLWWSAAAAVVGGLLIWQLPLMNSNNAVAPGQQVATNATTPNKAPEPVPAPLQQQEAPVVKNTAVAANTQPGSETANTPTTTGKTTARNVAQSLPAITPVEPVKTDNGQKEQNFASIKPAESQLVTKDIVNSKPSDINPNLLAQDMSKPGHEMTDPVLASAQKKEVIQESTVATAAPVQGELIMSVSSSGDNKLMDRVTNVARFFAKKRK